MTNYVSTDPNFGLGNEGYVSTDPNFGLQEQTPENQDNALKRGWNKMIQSVGITGALATGDADSAAQKIAEAARYQQANPGTPEGNELMAAWQRGDGISGGLKEVGGEFAKDWREASSTIKAIRATGANIAAMGSGIVEQMPNMLPPMAGMLGGGAAGSAVGPVGTVGGAWAGASTGNALVEGGGMAQEALHKAGINPMDTEAVKAYLSKNGDDLLLKAGIKGAVIGAVDTATMGIATKLLTGPAKAAAGRALVDMGVDVADQAAVKAAMKSPELAARVAADPIYKAATTGAQGVARNATAAALEPAGEFTGEYLGQGLATGEYDEKEAFLEAASSIGQSGATFAGQKAYAALKYPFKADKGGNVPVTPPATIAGDVLGTPEQADIRGSQIANTDQTEAEKALYTPKSLTALDRVAEIDAKLTAATPEESSVLQAERDSITASWPKATPGAETSFTTEAGARLNGQYALMEAGDLTTSHDESLRPVVTYPAELQPRERERHASEMQIQQIVGRLDPARLGESADVATGAPIVGADGLVESGNARTIALKRVYQANGQKAIDYKQYLKDNAARFGITPESVDAMQKPVLVRVRATPVNRAEFARQANQSTVARMSPSEQAKSDAAQIDSLDDLNPNESGDFSSGTSAGFIRRFMAKLPATEQAGLIDSAGRLSQAGYQRIRNAVLAKAYGDSPVLQRMVESLDNNLRNVGQALLRVAPQVAKTREAINEGALHDADLTPDLMAAVEELSALKDKGTSVAEALAQAGMFGDKLSPESRELLSFLDENIRSPRRMAEFVQNYLAALTAAGNPAQGSMFGESAAPAKRDLIAAARRIANGESTATGGADAGNTAVGQEVGKQSENPQGDQAGARGNETSEWLTFPPDTGTLGIPRAEMPQIKGDHRGALIQFLQGRGINHETVEMPASELKPTQNEFSTKKVANWTEKREGVDRSVLASSDGYILDGHHQWVAALAAGETEKVIRFDVPIQELLAAVREFPSVKKSEGAPQKSREAVRREVIEQQWQEALGDLGAIFRDLVPLNRMVPEDTPNLMPTLVKLFEAGFAKVGMGAVDLMKYVKAELKKIPEFKTVWNKIDNYVYRKAAEQALKNHQAAPQGDLFGQAVDKAMQAQGDLFAQPAQPEKKVGAGGTAMIDGRPYDMKRDNFKPPKVDSFLSPKVISEADGYVERYFKNKPPVNISAEDRSKAEELLKPILEKAAADKAIYDQKIIDITKRSGAISQMIAPLKGIGRAAEKLVVEEGFNVGGMKDILRSTIVVDSYADVQAVLDEITKEFKLFRDPKNRTGGDSVFVNGKEIKAEDPARYGCYSDVMVNVVMPSGVVAEIQINVPEMLGAKEAQGHKLYEAYREALKESPLGAEILKSMLWFYAATYAAAKSRTSAKNSASDRSNHSEMGPRESRYGLGSSESPSSESANHLPSGNSTKNPPSDRSPNRQPSGNLSGTFISSTSDQSIANDGQIAYTEGKEKSTGDANGQHRKDGSTSPQGQGTLFASATERGGDAAPVRDGTGGRDERGNRHADDGNRNAEAGVQERENTDRAGRRTEDGGNSGQGNRVRRDAGIPAGRDIPAKSGRNYRFGDGDLTYTGSWIAKARQNVEAVELLKQLQSENRQATHEEQAILAKFIGWGASDLANNIFGPQDASGKTKLDRQLEALENYDEAIRNLGDRPYLTNARYSEYRPAFELLQSKNPALNWYTAGNITKAMLDAAKPDASARKWGELRDRLKAALTPEEFKEASKSTQYAHYTSKSVVSSILSAVEKMGFKGGTILEPGAGIGVFPGLMQTEMGINSVYTGIEMDSITGGILKQLFPDERILVESFIDSKLPENFYDVAIGNPPFSGQVTVLADPKYAKHAFKLHDYFFAKSLDSVKPGGLVVFVTSRYTMDKKGDKARAFMAERADLVGAVRLPQTAFQKNAGTDVVTDVLFLRKKVPGETFAGAQSWMGLGEVNTPEGKFLINEYFTAHPEMVLGEHSGKGKMQNTTEPQYTLLAREGDIEAQFAAATANLPSDVFVAGRGSAAEAAKVREMDFDPKAEKEGAFYISPAGVVMRREGGVGVRAEEEHQKDKELIKDYVALRDAVKQAQYDQLNDGDWETSLKALQKAYAGFVKKNGRIQQNTAYMQKVKVDELDEEGIPTGNKIEDEEERRRFPLLSKLSSDPEWTLVSALESVNDEGEVKESDWLSKRTLGGETKAEIKTPTDALLATLDDTGEVNIPLIAERMGMEESEVIDSLGTLIYDDPASGWVMADEYLSGNVKAKLAAAEEAAKSDKRYQRNVDALKDVQPSPKGAGDIKPQIGMNWIPGEVYAQFLRDLAGVKATIEYVERTHEWTLVAHSGFDTPRATSDWGVGDRANAAWLMEKALTGATISLNKAVSDGKGGTKMVFDPDRTEAANAKRVALRQEFQNWIFQDAARTNKLVALYNDKFNTTVQRKFDGRHLTLPGTSKLFKIFDHVKRGAWRVIQTGNTYLAHAVGSGKTFEMVISAMEQKRLGKVKKPMIIVPGHMLQQFASEWQQLYPTARLAVADEKDFHTDNRRKFVARVAMSDLDGVIMTHSSFKLLDLDPTFKQEMIEQELEFLRASYEEAGGDLDDIGNKKMRKEPKIKRIEAQIERLEQSLAKTMSSEGKDKSVRFDEMGVDFLYVDEAHLFRKLSYATNRQMKGIDPNGSEMAWDLYMKTRWLAKKNPKRYLVMASGTPITNTTAELYTVQRFMAPEALEEKGLQSFDDWAAQFGEEATAIEATSSGKYEPVTRFSKFINVGEMTQMFRDFADVLTEDHLAALLGDARPKVEGGARKSIITPKTDAYVEFQRDVLVPRIEASKAFKPSFEQPNNPDPIININTDARLASIDMRFMEPSLPSDPDSKLNRMIDEIIRIYKETDGNEYRAGKKGDGEIEALKGAAQMVFFESGFGRAVAARRGFNARAWMEKLLRDAGIPPNQLAFMEDYKKSAAKLKLFKDVNTGKVRILVGSSAAMGTGVNAQQRLIALHHLDAPYVPATLEQREGRIIRQGNKNPKVQIYAYSMKGSFDENQWGMLARKKFFIEQAMSGDPNIREIDDVGEVSQLELAAGLVAENPYVLQHAGAKAEVERLMRLSRAHEESRARMQADYDNAGRTIEMNEKWLPDAEKEAAKVQNLSGDAFVAKADGKKFDNRKEWGAAVLSQYKALSDKLTEDRIKIGEMSGFDVQFVGSMAPNGLYEARVKLLDTVLASDPLTDPVGMAMRGVNTLVAIERKPAEMRRIISEAKAKRDSLTTRLDAPFPLAEQLANKVKEVAELEKKMTEYGNEKTGLAREQELEDAWQQRTGAITPMFSRGTGRGMALRDLQAVVDRLSNGFKNLPRVHVLESPAALSTKDPAQKALRDFIRQSDAWDDVEGATHNGEIYLFASGMADEARAEHVFATHEVTHYGLRGAVGKELDSALQHVWMHNAKVRKAAVAVKKARGLTSNIEATEEVLADMPSAELAKLTGWRRVVQVMRNWLNKAGAKKLAARLDGWMKAGLSDQEKADLFVADLVSAAREWVKSGKGSATTGTHLAEMKLADDWQAQEKWLEREAKARGYKNIDELAEKAYPVFEKLAALWREKHPADALLSRVRFNPVDVTSAAFKRWFGDSKVVDADGKPLVVYHGTGDASFTEFEYADGTTSNSQTAKLGFWFAKDLNTANKYAEMSDYRDSGVIQVYLRLNNPLVIKSSKLKKLIDNEWQNQQAVIDYVDEIKAKEKKHGFDGIIFKGTGTHDEMGLYHDDTYVAFSPTQIKSATSNTGEFSPTNPDIRFSRKGTPADRANEILAKQAGTWKPVDTAMRAIAKGLRVDTVTKALIEKLPGRVIREAEARIPGFSAMWETVKAGVVADYGVPDAVIDQRAMMQGRQRVQLRGAGQLIDKLATLTREESRVAYEWMNNDNPQAADYFEKQLPEESVKVLKDVRDLIDLLSQEAIRLGQLSPDAYARNKFAYLHRSYIKHTAELTKGEAEGRKRAIAVLGDQYKGRGMTDAVDMAKVKNTAPEWWNRKLKVGQADKQLRGEKFIRLERRAASGEGTTALQGFGEKGKGRLLEVAYWPAGEPIPARMSTWDQAGTWEVRDTKGGKLVVWRDFTKQERTAMGEIDEARYAIAKTLHAMIHDIETGKYLEWLAQNHAKKEGEAIDGEIVEASTSMVSTFKPGQWVKVPETIIPGTKVKKYGVLSGRYLPGPIWNDVRQTVGFRNAPLGETYATVHRFWKMSKTALSPAVHMNNVMANFVMADWHDVTAGHIAKALKLMVSKDPAAQEVWARFGEAGGTVGTFAVNELQKEQLRPLLEALEKEIGLAGEVAGKVGVIAAMQHMMHLQFPAAFDALKGGKTGQITAKGARLMLDAYEAEDQVFRLAAWLKAKEEGASDMQAGKVARKSFLDYRINAPWVQMMRATFLPFIAFTYRAAPMVLEIAAKKPWKLMKLGLVAGLLNAIGYAFSGGDEDDERKLLPEEKAGSIWGLTPKLIRMPWNDEHGSPVFLDVRRWVPVGDIFDTGATNAAVPLLPSMMPGGPLALVGEVMLNKVQFTGKEITMETDTGAEKAQKFANHLYKAFAPNIIALPGTYAFTGAMNAGTGKTDAFGREQSLTQAVASSIGIKLGSYPGDVLKLNAQREAQFKLMEIQRNITALKRERQRNGIDDDEFREKVGAQMEKKRKVAEDLQRRMSGR